MVDLRTLHLAFVGKLLSQTTHEFKNHLAVINESAGLMADLLCMEESRDLKHLERYQKITASITDRVALASNLTLALNHFGHAMDCPVSTFTISELLHDELQLLKRSLQQKQVALETNFAEDIDVLTNQASLCQFVVFTCLEYLLTRLAGEGTLKLTATRAGEDTSIELCILGSLTSDNDQSQQLIEELSEALASTKARLSHQLDQAGAEALTLTLTSLS